MLTIKNLTRTRAPSHLNFAPLTKKVLGPNYNLSLVFIGDRRARALNQRYRQKSYAANILTFPLDRSTGEIFINLRRHRARLVDLFIHGLLHLKGLPHGSKMDALESQIFESYRGYRQKHYHWS